MAGAARAKEVERASDSKKLTPFERTALKAGVPMDLVDAMQTWYQACPRPEKHPMSIEGIITTFSQELGNMVNLQSNLTQATKLYQYAQLKGFTEEDFRIWLYDAAKRARREGVSNKMAYFFVALKVELLVALTESQWSPQPPEPDGHVVEEMRDAAEMTNDQEEAVTTCEEPLEVQQDDSYAKPDNLPSPTPSEASAPSERESEQEPALMIFCDDPTAGWNSYETATWWADRLRDHLGEDYGYTIWPTKHGKWAFVFFADQDPNACEAVVTGSAVTYYMHHGWQPPMQEQS